MKGKLVGVAHDCNDIPDAAMTLAVAAMFAHGPTTIRNVYNWRVKETERMVAIVTECRKLGAEVAPALSPYVLFSIQINSLNQFSAFDEINFQLFPSGLRICTAGLRICTDLLWMIENFTHV